MISICLAYLIFTFREFKSIHKGKTAILHLRFGTEKNRRLGSKKARYNRAFRKRHLFCLHIMPVMDGYELVSELRSAGYQIPVLMITAKSSFDDMRQGFLSGSDDYMVKPVNVNEMVLRVGALLRRAQILNEHKIVIGSTELDYDAMTVVTGDETLVLPKKEFLLLYKLAASPGRTFTKQQLMDEVWGYDTEADPHTIEVHIGRIRERFKENPDFEIVTMRGLGYKVVKK